MTKAGANQPSVPRQLSRRATSKPVRLEQSAARGDRRPDIKDARPQTGILKSPTSETGAKQHRARAAPRAEKQLAPQFYLVQFTGFYKYLKLFLSHTCALDPIRPESAVKITWCHATTSSFCLLLSAGGVSAPAVLQSTEAATVSLFINIKSSKILQEV
jgi:hypothetical protein